MKDTKKRTCFTCAHFSVCQMRSAIAYLPWSFNIDGEAAPGRYVDVFEAIARACLHYTYANKQ